MERPKLKNYPDENQDTLSKHQRDLIEWSWWAEERIIHLESLLPSPPNDIKQKQ